MTDLKTLCVSPAEEAIAKLRQLTQLEVQSQWRYCTIDVPVDSILESDWRGWQTVTLNQKGHIAWDAGCQVLWLAQKWIIPDNLQGYPLAGLSLRLGLRWWAEDAKIFINGVLVQEGDLFDCFTRVLLSPAVTPGESITVLLRLVSPQHDNGALVRSRLIYEASNPKTLDPGFIADELTVLQQYLKDFAPEELDNFALGMAAINWAALPQNVPAFEASLSILREKLLSLVKAEKTNKISLLGHAHLDMAWLWSVDDTWDAAQRTFESALKLQQAFPDLTFCHSTPALYDWIEQHRPDLFAAIQKQVAAGRWEVVGGLWVEPELNLINGESIVRHILYAQHYVKEKFGEVSKVAWLPDSFGFCATLPQFLKQGGIEFFVTQKLLWNDTTQFPHGVFLWESPDGTQIFSVMSAPIGEDVEPIKMAGYAYEWERKTALTEALWLPGVGDHGGGPTRDMLEVAERWQDSPFFPDLEFTTAEGYLEKVRHSLPSPPVWKDELYLEFHRGCYTTHAEQKRYNRRCEGLLYQAELFASLACIGTGMAYPKTELEAAWKQVLFNQFHDILPGTSIPQVFKDADRAWQQVEQVGSQILQTALQAIASRISLPSPPQPEAIPIVVFNPLNWVRSQVVAVNLPDNARNWQVYDVSGKALLCQLGETSTLKFVANQVPAVGYCLFWLGVQPPETLADGLQKPEGSKKSAGLPHYTSSISGINRFVNKKISDSNEWILENQLLRVIVDPETGDLSSIFDKNNLREVLGAGGGNQLQSFQDSGQYWDAWNIDPNYQEHPLAPTELKSIQWVEQGAIQQRLRVVRQLGKSEFCQEYVLSVDSPVLEIVTTVDWQESHVLVKAAFPLNLEADYATYEIACGAIERTTKPETPEEKAKWEVPALHWASMSDRASGVSLLNDCKYGYDAQPSQLRLTLLRSPHWPNPEADKGKHEFTYAIYPHSGSWKEAHTVRQGYELNLPLQVMMLPSGNETNHLQPTGSLLDLKAENLILMAFKQSEDNSNSWVLRCYECHGEEAELNLSSDLGLRMGEAVDLLERPVEGSERSLKVAPWKVVSFRVDG